MKYLYTKHPHMWENLEARMGRQAGRQAGPKEEKRTATANEGGGGGGGGNLRDLDLGRGFLGALACTLLGVLPVCNAGVTKLKNGMGVNPDLRQKRYYYDR